MLKSLKRITYYVDDIKKAKQWYNSVLGIQPTFETQSVKVYKIGNCSLALAKSMNPLNGPNEKMQAFWDVDDIDDVFEKFIRLGAQVKTPITRVFFIKFAQLVDPFGNIIGLTCEAEKSETAHVIAFCRALASKESREELKGSDYLAELFLTNEEKKILPNDDSRKSAIENLVSSHLYGYIIARTAFIDSIFVNACENDIAQIVFLGAGYDTRPYRFSDKLKKTKIFELDLNKTQKRKIEVLRKNKINIPDSLVFIPINFKTDNIYDSLFKTGYDSNKKTLFIWEGVTCYLTKKDIEKTMNFIQRYSSEGSIVCFDYLTADLESMNSAEPIQFWIEKEQIEEMLPNFDLKIDEHIDSSELTKRYLTLQDGTIGESILTLMCLVKAFVLR